MATTTEVVVPDIGGFADVSVIDVLVKDGQRIEKDTPLITIETEKAAMDVPAPAGGKIVQVKLKNGDKVSQGSVILVLETEDAVATADPPKTATPVATAQAAPAQAAPAQRAEPPPASRAGASPDEKALSRAHASPSVRKFARELGVDLGKVTGTGPKQRITHDDVTVFVKKALTAAAPAPAAAAAWPKVPEIDFSKFGAIEVKPLTRIQRISGPRLQASWMNVPHVTQHDEADITELEVARAALKSKATQEDVKLTALAFIVRACCAALKEFPRFNSSLDPKGENLIFKKYINIGFATDTPNGLVVPVIHDADRKSIYEIARALAQLSGKARAGKLGAADMQGGTFTISSLGSVGGTAFTPIINAPEVAILGVSRSSQKPIFVNGEFVPRLMLPLSLSYDHRVVDGAAAARFVVYLGKLLADVKSLL